MRYKTRVFRWPPRRRSDHDLLEFGDDVVIGGDVHLSGHTVEGGFVKTAPVRLNDRVTVGLGSVISIGVTVGSDVQIGALSLVPKHVTLEGARVYAGVPARPLGSDAARLASRQAAQGESMRQS